MDYMTSQELSDFKGKIADILLGEGVERKEVGGVYFSRLFHGYNGCLVYSFGNAKGIINPDNGYRGKREDKKDYYPLCKVSPSYSDELRFSSTCSPNLESIASAIKSSWELFKK